jgi:hypothetical protein
MRRFLVSMAVSATLTAIAMGVFAIVALASNWPSGCC